MCARRFLMLIVFLTLLFVAAGFAIFEFGDRALTRAATPKGHYQEPLRDDAPDYAKDESWLAKPGLPADPSRWVPDGLADKAPAPTAATFFIHPTTYLERDRWNAPYDLAGETGSRASLFVQSQASAFNGVSQIWAPRYRQAAFGAFLLTSKDADQALNLAYRDLLVAFDRFIAAQPAGRPIILAGHSQGSLHLLRLLAERKAALKGRLVAAYVAGWPVSVAADLPATGLAACSRPDETDCVLSWQSFADPANPSLVTKAWIGSRGLTGGERRQSDLLCVNPLTGTRDGESGPASNLGMLLPDGNMSRATLEPGRVGATCRNGFLILNGKLPDIGPYVLPGNNYHVYDYALFWGSIRADAERRTSAWVHG
jgi:hypothetical protein